MAVDVLKSRGVPEDRILFLNLIASPQGISNFATKFPKLRVVTAFVDQGLDEKKCVPLRVSYCAVTLTERLATSSPASATSVTGTTPCERPSRCKWRISRTLGSIALACIPFRSTTMIPSYTKLYDRHDSPVMKLCLPLAVINPETPIACRIASHVETLVPGPSIIHLSLNS